MNFNKEVDSMCTALEKLKQQGIEQGKKEGIKQGIEQGKLAIIKIFC